MLAKWVKFKGDCSFDEGKFTSLNNLLKCLVKAWECGKDKTKWSLKKTIIVQKNISFLTPDE